MATTDPYAKLMGPNFIGPPRQPKPDDEYEDLIQRTVANNPDADPDMLRRLLKTESDFDRYAEGPITRTGERAQGIAQFMPSTAKQYGVTNPFDPEQAVPAAARYLTDLTKKYGGDKETAAAAYNFGPGNVDKGLKYPKETRDYVTKVAGHGEAPTRVSPQPRTDEESPLPMQTATQTSQATPPRVPPFKGLDKEGLMAYFDGMMAQDANITRALQDYDRRGPGLPHSAMEAKMKLSVQQEKLRHQLNLDKDDEEIGGAYMDWYNARFGPQTPTEAPAQEPGFLKRILGGVGDAAKMAVEHPVRSLANVWHGVTEFNSLPDRAIESLVMGEKGEFPAGFSRKKALRENLAASHQKDVESGVPEGSVGPEVMRGVGGALSPMPAAKLAKTGSVAVDALKNFGKGALIGGGVNVVDRVAEGEPITPEGVGGSAGLTGLLTSIFGRFGRPVKAGSTPTPKPSATEAVDGFVPAAGPGPRGGGGTPQIEYRNTEAGTRRWNADGTSTVHVGPSPKALPAPSGPLPEGSTEITIPTAWQSKIEAAWRSPDGEIFAKLPGGEIKSAGKPGKAMSTPDQPVQERSGIQRILDLRRNERGKSAVEGTPPPNTSLREIIDRPKDVATTKAGEAAMGDGSVPYPGSMYGMPGVKRPPEVVQGEIVPNVRRLPKAESAPVLEAPRAEAPVKTALPKTKANKGDDIVAHLNKANVDAEVESELGAILRGEKEVGTVPVGRDPKKELALATEKASEPIVARAPETPAQIVKQPPQATDVEAKIAAVRAAREMPIAGKIAAEPPKVEAPKPVRKGPDIKERVLPTKRVEEFIKDEGYKVREREPFPGQREYDVIDAKSGATIARGDRSTLIEGLGERAKSKGFKLHSFPGDVGTFKEAFDDVLRKVGAKVPEDVGVTNKKPERNFANATLQAFETPDFLFRKYKPARDLVSEAGWAERNVERRVKDLIYKEGPDGFTKTKLHTYFEMPASDRTQVDKVLVYGDRRGLEFTPEALRKQGLSEAQAHAYQGVREALDNVRSWAVGTTDDLGKIKGYIPRVWHGNSEIFVNGTKHIQEDGTSTFASQREAHAAAYKLKQADPSAKIDIKFFADPEYFGGRGFQDAQLVSRLKKNLESMGAATSADVDKAYAMGRDVKGFSKHLEMRKGETGYQTEGLDKILFNYIHQAAKHVEMDKLKEATKQMLKDHSKDMTTAQVHYLKSYVERVAGKPTWDQIAIHNWIGETPLGRWIDPISGNKFLKNARQLTTHLTLGMGNLSWAAMNVDTVVRHVWPALQREGKDLGVVASEKYLGSAVLQFFNDKALRQKLAHYGVIDIQHMSEVLPSVGHKFGKGEWTPARISIALGTATEEFVRGVSAIARFNMAKAQGMDEKAAMVAAARFVDATSGRYTKAGKPAAFQGAIGETVGMFKTYMSVFMQNGFQASSEVFKNPGTFTRYMIATMGVSGLAGLPFVDDVDEMFTRNMGWSPMEALQKHLPEAAMTGIASVFPGMMGHPGLNMDLSKKAGMPDVVPADTKSALGPVIGRFSNVIGDVAKGEFGQAAEDLLLPNSLKGPLSVWRGRELGVSMGKNDKPVSKLDQEGQVVKSLGFPPAQELKDSRVYQRLENKKSYLQERLRSLAHAQVSGSASESDQAEFRELGGTRRLLKNERARETQTLRERQMKHLPKILRRQVREAEDY